MKVKKAALLCTGLFASSVCARPQDVKKPRPLRVSPDGSPYDSPQKRALGYNGTAPHSFQKPCLPWEKKCNNQKPPSKPRPTGSWRVEPCVPPPDDWSQPEIVFLVIHTATVYLHDNQTHYTTQYPAIREPHYCRSSMNVGEGKPTNQQIRLYSSETAPADTVVQNLVFPTRLRVTFITVDKNPMSLFRTDDPADYMSHDLTYPYPDPVVHKTADAAAPDALPVATPAGASRPEPATPEAGSDGAVGPDAGRPGAVSPGTVPPGAVPPGEVLPGALPPGAIPPGEGSPGGVPAGDGGVPAGDGGVPAGGVPAGGVHAGGVPAGGVHAGGVPAGGVHAGGVHAGGVPAGDVPAGDVPAGDVPPGTGSIDPGTSSGGGLWPWPPHFHIRAVGDEVIINGQTFWAGRGVTKVVTVDGGTFTIYPHAVVGEGGSVARPHLPPAELVVPAPTSGVVGGLKVSLSGSELVIDGVAMKIPTYSMTIMIHGYSVTIAPYKITVGTSIFTYNLAEPPPEVDVSVVGGDILTVIGRNIVVLHHTTFTYGPGIAPLTEVIDEDTITIGPTGVLVHGHVLGGPSAQPNQTRYEIVGGATIIRIAPCTAIINGRVFIIGPDTNLTTTVIAGETFTIGPQGVVVNNMNFTLPFGPSNEGDIVPTGTWLSHFPIETNPSKDEDSAGSTFRWSMSHSGMGVCIAIGVLIFA